MAHSWPEGTIRLAPNGTMVGTMGYDRAHRDRSKGDDSWLIPPNDHRSDGIHADDKLLRPEKRLLDQSSYSDQFPMLQVAPGDLVAIMYTENGHVTKADSTNPTKPVNRGTIYLYGTTHSDLSDTNLMDVHLKWTADGKGGDRKGKLLATRNFDDGQCHEAVPDTGDGEGISGYRQQHISPATNGLSCQSDLQIPADMAVGQTLTVIWVWDWPSMNVQGVAVPPATYPSKTPPAQGNASEPYAQKPELYTGVLDYKIVDPCDESLGQLKGPTCGNHNGKFVVEFASQPALSRGIRSQMTEPFLVKVPQAGFQVASATADPSHIPMHALIGATPTSFPLPASILSVQGDQLGAAAPTGTAPVTLAPSTTAASHSTSTALPSPSSTGGTGQGDDNDSGIVMVTVAVTVPQSIVTVTVTAGAAAQSSSSAGSGAGTDGPETTTSAASTSAPPPLPSVTQFLPGGSSRRSRVWRARR